MDEEEASNVLLSVANALRERDARIKHTPASDKALMRWYREMPSKWREISKKMGGTAHGFSDDTCRNRVLRILKRLGETYVPVLNRSSSSSTPTTTPAMRGFRGKWTEEDDEVLFRLVTKTGFTWDDVVASFPGRTKQAIRNRSQRVLRVLRESKEGGADTQQLIQLLRSQATMNRAKGGKKKKRSRGKSVSPVLAIPVQQPQPELSDVGEDEEGEGGESVDGLLLDDDVFCLGGADLAFSSSSSSSTYSSLSSTPLLPDVESVSTELGVVVDVGEEEEARL